jgi:hypothetical protein
LIVVPSGTRLDTWIGRGRAVAAVVAGQAAVQALALVAGLAVIRLLPAEEFAAYTIAMAAVGAVAVISDCGIVSAVTAIAGRDWQDRTRLGVAIASGRRVRRRLTWIAVLVVLPWTAVLLHRQGIPPVSSALLLVATAVLAVLTTVGPLFEIVPRLHQRIGELQRVQIQANAARLAMAVSLLALAAHAALAIAASAVVQAWGNGRTRALAARTADLAAAPEPSVESAMLAQVRRSAPGALYFAVSAPLTVWIAAALGATSLVAEIGALGRVATVFTVVQMTLGMLAIPRFARLAADATQLQWLRYVHFQLGTLAACAALCTAVVLAAPAIRWIFGPEYASIGDRQFLLTALGSTASTLNMLAWGLATARGIVTPAWLVLPYCVLWRVLLVLVLPLDTLDGLLTLAIIAAGSEWLLHVAWYWRTSIRARRR